MRLGRVGLVCAWVLAAAEVAAAAPPPARLAVLAPAAAPAENGRREDAGAAWTDPAPEGEGPATPERVAPQSVIEFRGFEETLLFLGIPAGQKLCFTGELAWEGLVDLESVPSEDARPGRTFCLQLEVLDHGALFTVSHDFPRALLFTVETAIPETRHTLRGRIRAEPGLHRVSLPAGTAEVQAWGFDVVPAPSPPRPPVPPLPPKPPKPPREPRSHVALSVLGGAVITSLGPMDETLRALGYEAPSTAHPFVGGALEGVGGHLYFGLEGHGWLAGDYTAHSTGTLDTMVGGGSLRLGWKLLEQHGVEFVAASGIGGESVRIEGDLSRLLTPAQLESLPNEGDAIRAFSVQVPLALRVEYPMKWGTDLPAGGATVVVELGYRFQVAQDPWSSGNEPEPESVELPGLPGLDLSGPYLTLAFGATVFE